MVVVAADMIEDRELLHNNTNAIPIRVAGNPVLDIVVLAAWLLL